MRARSAALLGGLLLAACSPDAVTSPISSRNGPSRVGPPAGISGALLGPDGNSLCNAYLAGTTVRVRLLPKSGTPVVAASQLVVCPANTFAFTVPGDTYAVIVDPPSTLGGTLPYRWLDTALVDNTSGPQVHDVKVEDGLVLGGGVTRDGVGIPNYASNLVFSDFRGVLATALTTDASGAWVELTGRTPPLLQSGQRYRFSCPTLGLVGSRPLGTLTNGDFEFPSGTSSFTCSYTASALNRYTHHATDLLVSALPGDIGGLSTPPDLAWGVQFPVAPGSAPALGDPTVSELYRGGLVIAVGPNKLLTGYSTDGYQLCGGPANDACRDLTATRRGRIDHLWGGGRMITWDMNDDSSAERIGLHVRQRSFDTRGHQDVVWFQYRITNTSRHTETFYAGFWGDWDIGTDPFDDVGATALDGKLMYFHNADGTGPFVGSLVVGPAPLAGNEVYVDGQVSAQLQDLAGQFQLASGGVTNPATTETGDQRDYHTIGPITLRRWRSTTVWIGIVAGNTEAELLANAQSALRRHPFAGGWERWNDRDGGEDWWPGWGRDGHDGGGRGGHH